MSKSPGTPMATTCRHTPNPAHKLVPQLLALLLALLPQPCTDKRSWGKPLDSFHLPPLPLPARPTYQLCSHRAWWLLGETCR